MTTTASAKQFIEQADIPTYKGSVGTATDTVTATLDAAKQQALVVGADVVSFVKGVTAERRSAIIHSSLLAQLVATKKVGDPIEGKIIDWYKVYFSALTNVGWVLQEKNFVEYHEQSDNFEAHKAILSVATTLLGPVPTALALVKTTIDALHSMNDSPWIALFNRESQHARAARFQISLAEQQSNGQFLVTLMAFALEAKTTMTQVLFFKAKSSEATLRHCSGRVTVDTAVLDGIGNGLKAKLVSHANDYIAKLPDL
jgi:hypothetical protein